MSNDLISRWVEETGRLDHDQNLLPDILPEIPVGGTVVDVGAHIGSHTIAYLAAVGETGKVLAVEPNEDAWDCLRRNCPSAKISRAALWDKPRVRLTLVREGNSGASYVLAVENGELSSSTLDILLQNQHVSSVDLIKLDCEGCEVRVLRGAEKTIARCRPKLLIEVNCEALKRQGFDPLDLLAWLKEHQYDHRIVQSNCDYLSELYDILCKPREEITYVKSADAPHLTIGQGWVKLGPKGEPLGTFMWDGKEWLPSTVENVNRILNPPAKLMTASRLAELAESFNSVPNPPRFEAKDGEMREVKSLWHPQAPWKSSLESIEEIKHLAYRLKSFCTAPAYTRRVRDELAAVGLTKPAVVKRRRKRK